MKNSNLHGNTPDTADTALLIIDMINDLEFDEGHKLKEKAEKVANNIAKLKENLKGKNIPAIYVNDNFGKWQSNLDSQINHCLNDHVRGAYLTQKLKPDANDYFVLKTKHSGFYETPLHLLLQHLQVETVILTGLTTDMCILFTASDAYLRDYNIVIVQDCVTTMEEKDHKWSLQFMQKRLKAQVVNAIDL